jgi:hypothetical protein
VGKDAQDEIPQEWAAPIMVGRFELGALGASSGTPKLCPLIFDQTVT